MIKIDDNSVIVFDLDDTLYNEIDYLLSAYKYIAQKINHKEWLTLYAQMLSWYKLGYNVFEKLSEMYPITVKELIFIYRHHNPNICLSHNVKSLLYKIKETSHAISIITDGRSITQRNKLEALSLDNFFDDIIISEEFGSNKEEGVSFSYINNKYLKYNLMYIADNISKDFYFPNKLKWLTICIIDNFKNIHINNYEKYDNSYKPKIYIESLVGLLDYL